ncbi:AAA family ATPase [Vibrio cholerae]|nr:AAA family ATPase [Vibrio cholerae]
MTTLKTQFLNMLGVCIENSRKVRNSIIEQHLGSTDWEAKKIKRLWSVKETCELVGVSHTAIKKREADGSLPPPLLGQNNRVAGYSIYDIENMRQRFDRRPHLLVEGDNGLEFTYRPYNQLLETVTVCICGHKGGSYKTTVSVLFAQWLAMVGYKVALIDGDPQSTLTRYMGFVPDREISAKDTIVPYMKGEQASLHYALKKTHWPNIDLIPSCLALQALEHNYQEQDLPYSAHMMLKAGIETIAGDYDIVIVDGSPNLGRVTLNQFFAADLVICPTTAELLDYSSTEQFFEALFGMVNKLDDEEVSYVPDVRALITKYSYLKSSSSHLMDSEIRKAWGGLVFNNRVQVTEEIGKQQYRYRTIFEQEKKDRSAHQSWNNAQGMFINLFQEILTTTIQPRWEA